MHGQVNPTEYRRKVMQYHSLPVTAAIVFVGVPVAASYLIGKVFWSILVASALSLILLWRWVVTGMQIDRWGCPKCGEPFPKKMRWSYPPKVCPNCGDRLNH